MIDYVNLRIPNKEYKKLMSHPQLEWTVRVNEQTGEIYSNSKIAYYKGMKFLYKTGKGEHIQLQGSIHKHYQNGYNHQDYSFSDVIYTIIGLCETFDLDPYEMVIKAIEFGLNVVTPFNHWKFIMDGVLCYKYRPFQKMESKRKKTVGIKRGLQQIELKMYSKKYQYQLPDNVMRWEVHFSKQQPLKKFGISSWGDVLDSTKLLSVMKYIQDVFKDILVYEPNIRFDKLKSLKHRNFIDSANNGSYWIRQLNRCQKNRALRNSLDHKRTVFRKLNEIHTIEPQQEIISDLLRSKVVELMRIEEPQFRKLTKFLEQFPEYEIQKINYSSMGLIFMLRYFKSVRNEPDPKRYCISCGKDISHQERNTIYCTELNVGEKDAHRCRNNISNPRNNMIRTLAKRFQSLHFFCPLESFDIEYLKEILQVDSKQEIIEASVVNVLVLLASISSLIRVQRGSTACSRISSSGATAWK